MEEQITKWLAQRIKYEYNKHKHIEGWEEIAAKKIVAITIEQYNLKLRENDIMKRKKNKKQFFYNLYLIVAIVAGLWTLFFPIGAGMKDFPIWTGWVSVPLTITFMIFENKIDHYFDKFI